MGTNYYIGRRDEVQDENYESQTFHIGKNSGGWAFHFQGKVCKTVDDWKARLADLPGEYAIFDEYGRQFELAEFWMIVNNTLGGKVLRRYVERAEYRAAVDWADQEFNFSNHDFS